MLSSSDCSLKSQSSEKKLRFTSKPMGSNGDVLYLHATSRFFVTLGRNKMSFGSTSIQVWRCGGLRLCFVCLEPQRNWQHPEQPPKSTCKVPCQQHLGLKLCTHPQPHRGQPKQHLEQLPASNTKAETVTMRVSYEK